MDANQNGGFFRKATIFFQIVFYIIVSFGTIYSIYLTRENNKLIFKPVVGITDIKTTRLLKDPNIDTYENVVGAQIKFVIENVGNLPAKDVRIKVEGRLGNIILPRKESDIIEGVTLIQKTKVFNTATISKNTLDKLITEEEQLFYDVNISYTDLEEHDNYDFYNRYKVVVRKKEPLNLSVFLSPKITN